LASTNISTLVVIASKFFCQEKSMGIQFCSSALISVCGKNKNESELDERILPNYFKHIAHAISLKQVNHYYQLYLSKSFRQYDHGKGNLQKYNQSKPPEYDLKSVKAEIYLYAGGCDAVVAVKDFEHLRDELSNVKKYKILLNYNHCDFNYGKNTRSDLFEEIIKAINFEE
jgi:lysosomal acid lipase/cholesteryl ester hydrolase